MIEGTGPIATMEEAAKCVGCSITTLECAVRDGSLRSFRLSGKGRVVAQEWLEDYYNNNFFKFRKTRKLDFSRGVWHSYDDALMSLPEAAEYLGIPLPTIGRAAWVGHLRTIQISRMCRLTTPDWLSEYRPDHLPEGAHADNKSGRASPYRGVTWMPKNRKWGARVLEEGKPYYLRSFTSEEEAHEHCLLAREIGVTEYYIRYPKRKVGRPRRVQS